MLRLAGDIDPAVAGVLSQVGNVMEDARDDWCLIGGVAALLHGVPVVPLDDIDVLLTPDDAYRVLSANGIRLTPDGGTAKFRSQVFSRCAAWPIQVDFLAGFEVQSGGDWVPVLPRSAHRLPIGHTELRVPSVEELIAMHLLFSRPKDGLRVQQLQALSH